MASSSGAGMFLHGEPTCELRDGSSMLLVGNLSKKSTWIGKWRVRRFELYKDGTLKHYKLLSGQHLGTVSLKPGSYVRQIVDTGYGRKFQLITADGKVYSLHAPNVETRDTWCHHLQRMIHSAIDPSSSWGLNGWGALPVAPSTSGGSSNSNKSSSGVASGSESSGNDSSESELTALAGSLVDVAIPQGCDAKKGCELSVPLMDGRVVHVQVPPQTPPGGLVRVPLPPLAGAGGGGSAGAAAAPVVAISALSLRPSLALDACSSHCVPILVPCAPLVTTKWGQGFGASSSTDSGSASSSSSSSSAPEQQPPLPQPPYAAEAATAADLAPPKTAKFASELPPHLADKYELEDDTSTALITSKYNMKMLSALGKMETDFRNDLAAIWGVEDEEALPEALQGLDFHDILLSGDTEAVRTAWLLSKLTEAPGYLPTKMKRTVAGMTEKTIQMIQELERQYAS